MIMMLDNSDNDDCYYHRYLHHLLSMKAHHPPI